MSPPAAGDAGVRPGRVRGGRRREEAGRGLLQPHVRASQPRRPGEVLWWGMVKEGIIDKDRSVQRKNSTFYSMIFFLFGNQLLLAQIFFDTSWNGYFLLACGHWFKNCCPIFVLGTWSAFYKVPKTVKSVCFVQFWEPQKGRFRWLKQKSDNSFWTSDQNQMNNNHFKRFKIFFVIVMTDF